MVGVAVEVVNGTVKGAVTEVTGAGGVAVGVQVVAIQLRAEKKHGTGAIVEASVISIYQLAIQIQMWICKANRMLTRFLRQILRN